MIKIPDSRLMTQTDLDAWNMDQLKKLIEFAGSRKRLAQMLSVPTANIDNFIRAGRISKLGALLVEKNERLSQEFSAERLRPDLFKNN